ncbi:hypothetical protein Tco_1134136 [Tanacetum coccineum]
MHGRSYLKVSHKRLVALHIWGKPADEELEAPIEDQLLPADASPTTLSPGYIVDFDPKEDEEDPEEDHVEYPADGGDNDDNKSSNDETIIVMFRKDE